MTYNNVSRTFSGLPNPLPIIYNGNTVSTLSEVDSSVTVNCIGKFMVGNITFGNRTMECAYKKMLTNVVFTLNSI